MVRGPIEIERIILIIIIIIIIIIISSKWIGFLRAFAWTEMSQTLQKIRKWWKFTYSGVFGNGRGKMAQQRHLERSP